MTELFPAEIHFIEANVPEQLWPPPSTTPQPGPAEVKRPRTNPVLTADSRIGDAAICPEGTLISPSGR
jgi:hypothetical protein